jgi:hypothetical protein
MNPAKDRKAVVSDSAKYQKCEPVQELAGKDCTEFILENANHTKISGRKAHEILI